MENTANLKTFPLGTNKGYLFASFTSFVPIDKVVDYIQKQGTFLSLEGEFHYDGKNSRTVEISTLFEPPKSKFCATYSQQEIIVKASYTYNESGLDGAKNDADSLVEHIKNLILCAERANSYFANRNKPAQNIFKTLFA